MFGFETVDLFKRQEAELEMLKISLGMLCYGDYVREARLRWFGQQIHQGKVGKD